MVKLILFAPLIGALIGGFGWKMIGETAAQYVTTGLLFLACALSWIVFLGFDGETQIIQIFRFIESGSLSTDWAIRLDRLDGDYVDRRYLCVGFGASLQLWIYGSRSAME